MTLLRFRRASDGKSLGVLTWFPVHGTSLLGNHTHVAADNKGVAAWLLEEAVKADGSATADFVAGFSQANVGDTTPNVFGAYCDDGSGQRCGLEKSTCADGKSQTCHGRGPEFRSLDRGVKSCYEMGRRQFKAAKEIYVGQRPPWRSARAHLRRQRTPSAPRASPSSAPASKPFVDSTICATGNSPCLTARRP